MKHDESLEKYLFLRSLSKLFLVHFTVVFFITDLIQNSLDFCFCCFLFVFFNMIPRTLALSKGL